MYNEKQKKNSKHVGSHETKCLIFNPRRGIINQLRIFHTNNRKIKNKICAILIIKSELSRVVTFHREVRGRWWDDEPSKKLFDKYNIGVEIYGT